MLPFLYDMPVDELRACRLPLTRQPDFDSFWHDTLARNSTQPLDPTSEPVEYSVPRIHVERIRFSAFDGGRIAAWFIAPDSVDPSPTLVFYHGYAGSRGDIADYLMWALQGFACLAVDVRGQNGESEDHAVYPGGRTYGWMSCGLTDPASYYYVRAYADAVRAVEYACSRSEVDGGRLGVSGCSQGGTLALAACALDKRPRLCIAEVPGFCDITRSLQITRVPPWTDLTGYFQRHPEHLDTALKTFSYVELNNLAEWVTCPALISVGLLDDICIPSGVYSVYNRLSAKEKHMDEFPFNGHECGLNRENQIVWARRHLMI